MRTREALIEHCDSAHGMTLATDPTGTPWLNATRSYHEFLHRQGQADHDHPEDDLTYRDPSEYAVLPSWAPAPTGPLPNRRDPRNIDNGGTRG